MKFTTAVLYAVLLEEIEDEEQRALFRRMLTAEGQRRRDRRLHRTSLLDPKHSPFRRVYDRGSDSDLITLTGLDRNAFSALNQCFKPTYDMYTPISRPDDGLYHRLPTYEEGAPVVGRPRLLDSIGGLGLVLSWGRSRGSHHLLDMVFGITDTDCSTWLEYSQSCLLKVLRDDPRGAVRLPQSRAEVDEFVHAVRSLYPELKNVWSTVDGLKVLIQKSGSESKQRRFYVSWPGKAHWITNVFIFTPDGCIAAFAVGAPGVLGDSLTSWYGKIYNRLSKIFRRFRVKSVADSAFMLNKNLPYIIKCNENALPETPLEILINEEALSLRQSVEWGMRGFEGAFPRLKDPFTYEEVGRRQKIMEMLVRLYNFRTRTVGLSHIHSTFMPCLDADIDGLAFLAERHWVPPRLRRSILERILVDPEFESSDDDASL